jgi:hypothetical protein
LRPVMFAPRVSLDENYSLLFCPGGRNRKTMNQIGTITSAPKSKFGQAQAKPARA